MARQGITYESLGSTDFVDGLNFQDLSQPYEGVFTDPFFMANSWAILNEQREERVKRDIIPNLEQQEATWHPLGFMVISLGMHSEYGSLRLHIWPEGHRDVRSIEPGIHDHAWHLASVVMHGTYRDEFHRVSRTADIDETERRSIGALRSFQVGYNPGLPDELAFDGNTYTTEVTEERRIEERGIHWIKVGQFHKTTIPIDECVATMVLDSRPMGFRPRVLLDTDADSIQSARRRATVEELAMAREQITA